MGNILPEFLADSQKPLVQVLLATYNGEIYLNAFLDSLLKQQGVRIELIVSDDGSRDKTLEILTTYRHSFHSMKISAGPKKGPAANFLYLLELADAEYVALADQDDIWHTNHLENSILRLKNSSGPGLTFCAVSEFRKGEVTPTVWPRRFPTGNIFSFIAENYARGCTIVLNGKALRVLQLKKPKHAIMHDWWMLIVIGSVGQVFWSENPEIDYRVHDSNTIGPTPHFWTRAVRYLSQTKKRSWEPLMQIREIYAQFENIMTEQNQTLLRNWLGRAGSRGFLDRTIASLVPYRFRSQVLPEILIRVSIFINRN